MRLRSLVCAAALFLRVAFSQPVAPPKQAPSQIQSPSYDDLVAKALSLLAEKKAKESVAASEQAIAVNDKRWEAYASAASAYSAQRLYDDTIGMLQMALGRAPEGRKQAIRDAIASARRQIAVESAPKASQPQSRAEPPPPQPETAQSGTALAQAPTAQAEAALWKAIENGTRAEDYQGYLSKYPDGAFAPIAKARLDAILKKQAEDIAKEKKAKISNLVGSAWQGTIGEAPLTMKFRQSENKKYKDPCTLVLVKSNGVANLSCLWERVGDTLLIEEDPTYAFLPMPVPNCINAQYVLTLKDDTANGVAKSQHPRVKGDKGLTSCPDVEIKLKLVE